MTLPSSLPTPKLPDAYGTTPLRWGVVGPGGIAHSFVASVLKYTGQRFTAVASSDIDRARAFAEQYGIPTAYGSYEDLFAAPDVDAVYVATRQEGHLEPVLGAIRAGKHVLVEKPIAMLPHEVETIMAAASAAGVLVMEAMWTTYLPQSYVIRQLLADGVLGSIRLIQADLGQDLRHVERLVDPNGGGAALDVGIYPIAFSAQFFDHAPVAIHASGSLTTTGVDAESVIRLDYGNDSRAIAYSSILSFSTTTAWVDGEHASIALGRPFFTPTSVTLFSREFNPTPVAHWDDNNGIRGHEGLCYQATAFASYVEQGLTASPFRPLEASLRDIQTITEARHQFGAIYPVERA
ncbi:MAG TPA: Gfo/Idh/MocA family oxidoreductase [Microbacteriaceae bacterium]|nr:Gfo/Idh/MocA family oxidoreductase [Microbacteriaceae bacterium]